MSFSLNTFKIFNAPPVDYMDLLAPLFETYVCPSGTVVLRQGKPADYLYLIIGGTAKISYKPYDGSSITLAHVENGELFGWSAAVGSKYYTSSVIALEPLETVRARGSDLRKFCVENPEAGKDLLAHLANSVSWRWPNTNEQVMSILAQGMRIMI
jgi:CRP/FNR family transcriptional regulator, cyclic AMP receptor protein